MQDFDAPLASQPFTGSGAQVAWVGLDQGTAVSLLTGQNGKAEQNICNKYLWEPCWNISAGIVLSEDCGDHFRGSRGDVDEC